jgi:hypothetical protein
MSELYLGYASFVYFVSKRGYIFQSQSDNRVTFWLEGNESPDEYDPYQLMYKNESDCGCIVFNSFVLDERFNGDKTGLVKDLKKCKREKRTIHDKITKRNKIDVPHCYEPGHKTTIYDEEIVECKRYTDE